MTYNHVYDTNEQSRHPKYLYRASLVVQWLRVCFAMQGHRFDPWSGSSHMLWDSEAREPQRLSPSPTAHASQLEKPLQREACTQQLEQLLLATRGSSCAATKTQHSQKINDLTKRQPAKIIVEKWQNVLILTASWMCSRIQLILFPAKHLRFVPCFSQCHVGNGH